MKKKVVIIVSIIAAVIALAIAVPFTVFGIESAVIDTDYKYLKKSELYSSKVEVTGVELVTQHISCGYATIEMMSSYYGNKVTEDELSKKNGGNISTSSSDGFLKEINASIKGKGFVKSAYLNNDVLLKEIHLSLSREHPVAIEWAAKDKGAWTLHFSIVTGLDIANDVVTVYNPYGEIENITVGNFISRTTFKAYENMPLFLCFGFAYGAFSKNTIFFATK